MGANDPRPTPQHAKLTRDYFDALIGPLREVAREQGYAIGVHGSLERDIDLIAVPWREACSEPVVLAESLRDKAKEILGHAEMNPLEAASMWHVAGNPGMKPHGRLCWSFHLGGCPYIDLSVMPRRP